MAARSCLPLGSTALAGALPTAHLHSWSCQPPGTIPCPAAARDAFAGAHLFQGVQAQLAAACDPEAAALRVLTINCGGLGSKIPQLLMLLDHTEADVVCLQEVDTLDPADLHGLGYRVSVGAARRGGGLATLISHRLLGALGTLTVNAAPHGCLLTTTIARAHSVPLSIQNLHLPPILSVEDRVAVCVEAVGSVDLRVGVMGLLCGDLNATLRGSWLAAALRPRGIWAGWRCPYPPGVATNFVQRPAGLSSKEIDWVLISPTTPCTRASRVCLPGLSTHRAVQCDLALVIAGAAPLNPTGRRFMLSRVPSDRHPLVGATVGLAIWWGWCAGLPVDALVLCAWAAMDGLVPEHRRSARDRRAAALQAAEDLAASGGAEASECLRQWWADRGDAALLSLLHLDQRRLAGVCITSQTGRTLRLSAKKVQTISAVSADGRTFPSERGAFLAEVLTQGRELYIGRAGLRMDACRLIQGAVDGGAPHLDTPDYASRMSHLLPVPAGGKVGAPVTARELATALHCGSNACALDELPRAFLRHVGPAGLGALVHALSGVPPLGELLTTVLHLALIKKEPAWLLRNSRPVLLEPVLRRMESAVQFRRLMCHMELSGSLPPEMYAYRKQFNALWAPVTLRWLIAWWVECGLSPWIIDWDESNTYCNIPRADLEMALASTCPGLGTWAEAFFDSFSVRIVTARGLTAPYRLAHGCGQGDSGGVGVCTALGALRAAFHRGVLTRGLHPRDLTGGALRLSDVGLPLPGEDILLR